MDHYLINYTIPGMFTLLPLHFACYADSEDDAISQLNKKYGKAEAFSLTKSDIIYNDCGETVWPYTIEEMNWGSISYPDDLKTYLPITNNQK